MGIVGGAVSAAAPFEPFDAEIGEHGGIAEREQHCPGGLRIPFGWLERAGNNGCYRTVGRIDDYFVESSKQQSHLTEHTDQYKSEVYQTAGSIDCFGIGNPSDDGLSEGEIDGAAQQRCEEGGHISTCA